MNFEPKHRPYGASVYAQMGSYYTGSTIFTATEHSALPVQDNLWCGLGVLNNSIVGGESYRLGQASVNW